MNEERREDTGRFTEIISLESVIGVFNDVEGPVVTSEDIAETLDCSRETARRKLRALEKQGRLASRRTAGRIIWWRVDSWSDAGGIYPEDVAGL